MKRTTKRFARHTLLAGQKRGMPRRGTTEDHLAVNGLMLTPDHLQARVNIAGRMIAGGGLPVGALLTGLLAEAVPIRLAFGLPTFSAVIGAGLAGWSCLGSRPLALPGFPVKATHVNSGNNVSRCS